MPAISSGSHGRHWNARRGGDARADTRNPELRRWSIHLGILEALGRFFAKLRAAVGFELYARTGSRTALERAVQAYREARGAWADASVRADGVHVGGLTFGPQDRIRGHRRDRLPAVDADLADMERRLAEAAAGIALRVMADGALQAERVELRYRPMNQALAVSALEMERERDRFVATIPDVELDGGHPLAYALVLRDRGGIAWRVPASAGISRGPPTWCCGVSRLPIPSNRPDRRRRGVP